MCVCVCVHLCIEMHDNKQPITFRAQLIIIFEATLIFYSNYIRNTRLNSFPISRNSNHLSALTTSGNPTSTLFLYIHLMH